MRWASHNCHAHCATCHRWLSDRPAEFTEWATKRMGDDAHNALMTEACEIKKRSMADKLVLYHEMLEKLEWMRQEREAGNTDRLEFTLED